jgi:hypothetical protein
MDSPTVPRAPQIRVCWSENAELFPRARLRKAEFRARSVDRGVIVW